jgi:hypothetical protein
MGHLLGNAVRLTPHDDILVVGEGIETMLSLVEAVPGLPVWAALSSGHLGAVLLPEGVQRLYIAIDRDPAGQRAAERLSARALDAGIAVRVLEPRLGDFNDDLRATGKEALRQHLAGQIGPEDRHRLSGVSCIAQGAVRGRAGRGSCGSLSRFWIVALPLPGQSHPPVTHERPSRDGQAAVKGAAPSRTGGD